MIGKVARVFQDAPGAGLRVLGFSFERIWVVLMFYSITPYAAMGSARDSLYLNMFISLCAMTVAMVFMSVSADRDEKLHENKQAVLGAAVAVGLVTFLSFVFDLSSMQGMLLLGIGGLLTGVGSAILLLSWLELIAEKNTRTFGGEIALAAALSFFIGLVVSLTVPVIAQAACVVFPIVSGVVMLKCDEVEDPSLEEARAESADGTPWSKSTLLFFAKILIGAAVLGFLQGFSDVFSGYKTFVIAENYGIAILLAAFIALSLLTLVVLFKSDSGISHAYRMAMLLFCFGCLLTPFLRDEFTYFSSIVYAGYSCFFVVVCMVCIEVGRSFQCGSVRAVAVGFSALNAGELLGMFVVQNRWTALWTSNLELITLVNVFALFVVHLLLFTETDLVRVGIGEVNMLQEFVEKEEQAEEEVELADPCLVFSDRYKLSPRERDVLPLLLQGRTIARICETLYISSGTVSTHIRHIYQKSGVSNRQELLDLAESVRREIESGLPEASSASTKVEA